MSITPNLVVRKSVAHYQVRNFHTTVCISDTVTQSYEMSGTFIKNIQKTKKIPKKLIGKTGISLIKRLQKVPGITRISISPYTLSVRIGDAFSWGELMEVVILAVLESYPELPKEPLNDQKLLELSKKYFSGSTNTKTPT